MEIILKHINLDASEEIDADNLINDNKSGLFYNVRSAIVLTPSGEDLGLYLIPVSGPETRVNIMAPIV